MTVTTAADIESADDGVLSLHEALPAAGQAKTPVTILFDPATFATSTGRGFPMQLDRALQVGAGTVIGIDGSLVRPGVYYTSGSNLPPASG
jgi:hypothetical protein